MAIRFDMDRMRAVRENHERWWNGTLERPLVGVTVEDAYPSTRGRAPLLSQANCADLSWSPEELIDALDAELSAKEYLGDAFPFVNFDAFGPGVLAAFCGARLDNSSGRVWFFPAKEAEIADIHVEYDPQNPWVRRVKEIYRAGLKKWGGLVAMGTPDLGGVTDVAATLRGTENLLTDLYDSPEEVLRLSGEIQRAWRAAFEDLTGVLREGGAPGYTDWSGVLSAEPSYILQCDFCYMIGGAMFKRFALPFLAGDAKWLSHSIYHLDGIGELTHLDDILAIPELNAVQWVYGAGQPGPAHWLSVYERIRNAGKGILLEGGAQEILEALPSLPRKGLRMRAWLKKSDMALAARLLEA